MARHRKAEVKWLNPPKILRLLSNFIFTLGTYLHLTMDKIPSVWFTLSEITVQNNCATFIKDRNECLPEAYYKLDTLFNGHFRITYKKLEQSNGLWSLKYKVKERMRSLGLTTWSNGKKWNQYQEKKSSIKNVSSIIWE